MLPKGGGILGYGLGLVSIMHYIICRDLGLVSWGCFAMTQERASWARWGEGVCVIAMAWAIHRLWGSGIA